MTNDRKKYFFDINNFDAPRIDEVDPDLPPPPPVFSLEEMGQAKQESFLAGKEEGIEDSRVSREQYIASQISGINTQMRELLLAEQIREKKYEEDILHLCSTLFHRIFPSLAAKHSIDEILTVIRTVISEQEHSKIIIEVPRADVAEISNQLSLLIESEKGRFLISGVDDLDNGSCRMKWENGGAQRHQGALIDRITKEIEDMLAPHAQKSHNSESDKPLRDTADDTDPVAEGEE